MKGLLSTLIIAVLTISSYSQQTKTDSLQKIIRTDKEDTNKVKHLTELSWNFMRTGEYSKANDYAAGALALAEKLKFSYGIADASNTIGVAFRYQGNYTEALKNFETTLAIDTKTGDKKGTASAYNNIGEIYRLEGNYPEALKNHLMALTLREEIGEKKGISASYNNIGLIYANQSNYPEALKNHFAALKIKQEIGDKNGIANSYNNIGTIYAKQGNDPGALEVFFNALKIRQEINDKQGIATSYNNIGIVYVNEKNYAEALKNYTISLNIYKEIGDKEGIARSFVNLGQIDMKLNKRAESEAYLSKGLALSKEIGIKERIKESYLGLAELDSAQDNYKRAFADYKSFIVYRDSIFSEENTKKTVQSQMQYDFDKKQTIQKAEQNKKDVIAQEELKRQRLIAYASIAGGILAVILLILVAVLLIVSYRAYKSKQRSNIEITKQKEIIEEKNKEVHDSITYAKRIQTAILPPNEIIKEALSDSFVLYKPKDIVSGDFYWLEKTGDNVLFAAVDCTGHGVPGAMVSVVGHSCLNRAVREFGLQQPAEILNKLTELVEETFQQSEVKDGMDISLCCLKLNKEGNHTLQWAGANNPLWIISSGQLKEVKADKQPIGRFDHRKPFTNHTIELQKGDSIYIYSDGYADQFGGPKGKKFMYKKFGEILLTSNMLPLEEQKKTLNTAFEDWKGSFEQVDDVLVIGVKI